MVALRKDVKVGLTIGAIAVSVIGVYAGLSALATDKTSDDTAKLNVSPMEGAKKGDSKADSSKPTVVDRTASRDKADANRSAAAGTSGTASNTTPSNTSSANPPAMANVDIPTTRTPAAGEDPWAAAFGTGRIQPAVTVTPEPGKVATVDRAADRADTIKSINGTNDGNKSVATADPSGSISSGGSTPVLTRTGSSTGNSAGTTDATKPTVAAGPEKSHTVVAGETIIAISSEYYGDGKYFSAILAANPQVNPNKLKPGTVLKIPALAKKEEKSDIVEQPTLASSGNFDSSKQYVVKSGDSLQKIASTLYSDSSMSSKIYDANKAVIGADPAKIKVGMVLALPTPPTAKK